MVKNNTNKNWFIPITITLLLVILVLGVSLIYVLSTKTISQIEVKDNMTWNPPEGFVKLDSIKVEGTSVAVVSNCKAIIAETSPERALALFNALNNKTAERPDIYESTASVLQSFNIKLEAVLVHKVDESVYYADSYFRIGNKILQLDMKPSDAMTVALRTGSPIYYKQELFDKVGQKVC
ncbi:MAG: bifunctional nuclease family protein [Candidatus Aenigmarchaeota archaeon]|nr:bifunctional nuclease family protein [Candidatus Aenigmarchaeota archaeon]